MNDEEFEKYLIDLYISKTTDGDYSLSPVPFCTNDMVTNEGGIAAGQMLVVSHDLERLTGRKPLEIEDLLETYSFVWKKKIKNLRDL